MGQTLAIAFGAGLASALLFASLASGSPFAVVLFYFALLPLFIAGLGWGALAAAFGGAIGALVLSIVFRSTFGMTFFIATAVPAWILCSVALRWTPAMTGDARDGTYPNPGEILATLGLVAVGVTTIGLIAVFGLDYEAYRDQLRQVAAQAIQVMGQRSPASPPVNPQAVEMLISLAPVVGAVVTALVLVLNLYLAGRIVSASGRLPRPWPDIPSLRLPYWFAVVVAIAAVGSWVLPGYLGHILLLLFIVGLAVIGLAGLACVHDMTRDWSMRGVALGLLYALIATFGVPLVFVVLLGLTDLLFNLRDRRNPTPPSQPS